MADMWMVVTENCQGIFFDGPDCFDTKLEAVAQAKLMARKLSKDHGVVLYSCSFVELLHEYVAPGPDAPIEDTRQIGMFS